MNAVISPYILIVGPSWVGDMVMAQSLLKVLKKRNPKTVIDVLAPAWTFSILSRMEEVAKAIESPFCHGKINLLGRYQLAKTLARNHYDQAIILPNSFKAALIPWLAAIPKRTGFRGEFRYGILNDVRLLNKNRYPLMIEQFIALGLEKNEALPPLDHFYPNLKISAQSQKAALRKFQPIWRDRPVLALCAGAEFGPSKRWPFTYYAEIARKKLQEGWDIWLFGSQKDKVVTDKIMQLTENQCENLAGRPNLAETIDLLSLVSGVITNDSGLLHVAAALSKPIVAMYGSTSPAFTPPLSKKACVLKLDLECQPCFARRCPLNHHRCMQDLTPDHVLKAMMQWST